MLQTAYRKSIQRQRRIHQEALRVQILTKNKKNLSVQIIAHWHARHIHSVHALQLLHTKMQYLQYYSLFSSRDKRHGYHSTVSK